VELPAGSYDRGRVRDFSAHLSKEMNARPELGPVGVTSEAPWTNSVWEMGLRLPGEDAAADREVSSLAVSAAYFDVLRIPILNGRNFGPGDVANKTIVVNQAMAHKFWGDADPVGKILIFGSNQLQVIGVVRDSYSLSLERVEPLVYQPFGGPPFTPKVLIRSGTPPEAIAGIVQQLDRRARTQATPLMENLERRNAASRIGAQLAAVLGIFALALATIGMSGVFGYLVQQRTKEIGIRMALGARPRQVIALVLSSTARAVVAGLAIGYVSAIFVARLLTGFLYGASPFDPRAYAAVAAVLGVAGIFAAFWPARRATRIDPIAALRCD
jgi:putative ABC transport system permease protein